jgi:hypothetical protein
MNTLARRRLGLLGVLAVFGMDAGDVGAQADTQKTPIGALEDVIAGCQVADIDTSLSHGD